MLKNDPYGIRTRVTAVKGRCLNRLTNRPWFPKVGHKSVTLRLSGVRSNHLRYRPSIKTGAGDRNRTDIISLEG